MVDRLLAEFKYTYGHFRVEWGSALADFSSSDDTLQNWACSTLGPRISWYASLFSRLMLSPFFTDKTSLQAEVVTVDAT